MSIKITRQKRPDRVICKWKDCEVVYYKESGNVELVGEGLMNYVTFPKSEIPNLIKALLEIQKTK